MVVVNVIKKTNSNTDRYLRKVCLQATTKKERAFRMIYILNRLAAAGYTNKGWTKKEIPSNFRGA